MQMQRGVITPPPSMLMHKAENKYEVRKVYSQEEAKQRRLRAILNKLTSQNFEKLFAQVLDVNISTAYSLSGFVSQIFEKALIEPTYCAIYADLCFHASFRLPVFDEVYGKISFKKLLLNNCQAEFERKERFETTARRAEEKEREQERIKACRRYLGNVRLIGELYRRRMFTERIMHECIKKLLGWYEGPYEENIEGLCVLMRTVGEEMDHPRAKEDMDAYFDMMLKLSTNRNLSSRIRFMLMDMIDLRKNRWQQRRKSNILAPWMVLHKAGERYTVSKASYQEEIKQRKLRAILNKLTRDNFERLFAQVLEVNVNNAVTLAGFVSQIYEKALMEKIYCELYADFCFRLAYVLPDFSEGYERITFRRLILNKCQEEFERWERDEAGGNRLEAELRIKPYAEEREEEKIKTHARMLGNVRLIGELYKRKMLTGRIMHDCIRKLLSENEDHNEGNIECLCILMCTVGEMIDCPKAKVHIDAYFDVMLKLSTNMKLSSQIRFMLMDVIDLRKNRWKQRRRSNKLDLWMLLHKVDERYIVGKTYDKEMIKQRKFKGILNKITPQNFQRLFAKVLEVNIDNVVTLWGFVSQIYEKAMMERIYCELYAELCVHLADALPELSMDGERVTFKRLIMNKCQEEFERWERDEARGKRVEAELKIKSCAEEMEEEKIKTHARMLGNIRLIGELYKRRMFPERIIHHCILELLGEYQNPDEDNIEALCTLISTIGEIRDHPKAKERMDLYFEVMLKLSANQKLSSRVRFLLMDAIELRNSRWLERKKVERPMTFEEVHRTADHKRRARDYRWACGPVLTSVEEQALAYIARDEAGHAADRFLRAHHNQTDPQYHTNNYALDRSTATSLSAGFIQVSCSGSQVVHSEAELFSGEELQEKSISTRRVFFREGSSMIDILSSSLDKDDEDGKGSPSRCLDVEGKWEVAQQMEKDCFIQDSNSSHPLIVDVNKLSVLDHEEEDISIIAERGQVACRDYPHSRHLCVKYPFNKTDHEDYCPQCYCYVCDALAPCEYWQGATGHCHASDTEERWNELRRSHRTIQSGS